MRNKKDKEKIKKIEKDPILEKEIKQNLINTSEIPQHLLNTLSEFSPAGYVLFTLDEHGNIISNTRFENDTALISLCWHTLQWAGAQDFINSQMFRKGFFNNQNIEEEPE